MRIASFLLLLFLGAAAFIIAIINNSGIPSSHLIKGSSISFIPVIICIINLILVVYSTFKVKNVNPPPLKQPTFIRWILIFAGVFFLFCLFTVFSVTLYSPYLFGSNQPLPQIGVISTLIMALILSAILFLASKMNTAKRPNLFRYIALAIAFFAVNLISVQCLILIYAVPVQPPTAYPFLSGLLTLAFIPFSILVLIISKSYSG